MKKTLLAAALFAGFAGAAQAETQVTLYGIIDTGIQYGQYTTATGKKATSFGETWGAQSGSRWGMKGVEELGNGLTAVFNLEGGFDSSNGFSGQSGRLFGRQEWVGLANNAWGRIIFGRVYSVPTDMLANLDPFAQGWGLANIGTTFAVLNTDRLDNAIQYKTPVFSGFQAGLDYSFRNDDSVSSSTSVGVGSGTGAGALPGTAYNSQRQVDVALTYTNGPLYVGASYTQMNTAAAPGNPGIAIREEIIGATYDFGPAKVYAAYSHGTNGFVLGGSASLSSDGGTGLINLPTGTNGYNGTTANSYLLGVSAPVGPATLLFASWQHQTLGGYSPGTNGLGSTTASNFWYQGASENVYSVGATYSLSKRTNLYAVAAYTKGYSNIAGQKATDAIVGIRHQF